MTKPIRIALCLAGALLPLPAMAQTTAPAAATATAAIDPARLVAATSLLDVLMPPATREEMVQGMMRPMLTNLRRGLEENPQFGAAMKADPRMKALFDQFMAKQEARSLDTMRAALPGMMPVMARAYARRFDVRQLGEIKAFFETPTGRAYMRSSLTIMSDPDVAAWQRDLMNQSMSRVQQDIGDLARQATALEQEKKP